MGWATTSTPPAVIQRLRRSNSKVNHFSFLCATLCLTEVGDAARASQKVREELPGKGKELKKDAEARAEELRGKADATVCLMVF